MLQTADMLDSGESVSVPHASGDNPLPSNVSGITSRASDCASSRRSSTSSKTVRKLALQADHARRLANIEAERERAAAERDRAAAERERAAAERERAARAAERAAERERGVAELELRAQLAEIDGDVISKSRHSSRSSSHTHRSTVSAHSSRVIESWLNNTVKTGNNDGACSQEFVGPVVMPNVGSAPGLSAVVSTAAHAAFTPAPDSPSRPTTAHRAPPADFSAAVDVPGAFFIPQQERHNTPSTHTLGTQRDNYCHINKQDSRNTHSDIQTLARAITELAVRKPKVNYVALPVFAGSPSDWLIFKRVYDSSKSAYTPAENLARLGSALRGTARDAVAIRLVAASDPEDIIAQLHRTFGQSELIILQEVNRIKSFPKLTSPESKELTDFACKVRSCVDTIKLLNQVEYLASPELTNAIVGKMPIALRGQWAHFAYNRAATCSKLELLSQFLDYEAEVRNRFGYLGDSGMLGFGAVKSVKHKNIVGTADCYATSSTKSEASSNKKSENLKCSFCHLTSHNIDSCQKFIILSVDDKWRWVKDHKVCHRCLKKGNHRYRFCKSKEACINESCNRRHHRLLHRPPQDVNLAIVPQDNSAESISDDSNLQSDIQQVVTHTISKPNLNIRPLKPLLKIVAVTIRGPTCSFDTFALLDDDSTGTFIDSKVSEHIGARGPNIPLRMECVGGLSKETTTELVSLDICGRNCSEFYHIKARSMKNLNLGTRQSVNSQFVKSYPYLKDICDHVVYEDAVPTILIGVDNWHLTISRETRSGTRSQPVACNTALGWVLYGMAQSKSKQVNFVNHCTLNDCDEIKSIINDYYNLDSVGITKKELRSTEDDRAIKILDKTARRLPNGRFEVGLLWREENLDIPKGSYKLALNRFTALEQKFAKDPQYAKQYRDNIQATIDKGYVEPCMNQPNQSTSWYLPHFGVTNPNKPGKLRVVHDAAAKCCGVSLNNMLLSGPDLLQSLFDILLRFREGKIALSGDIREMFPQIKVRVEDRDAQRFLWRLTPIAPITIFRMSSMIFGAVSSPFTALYIKNKNALEFKSKFSDAVNEILNNHYMDDFLGSFDNVMTAANIARDVSFVHQQAGFEMRSWVSNCPKALEFIPSELKVQNSEIELGHFPTSVRTLGLIWFPLEDVIGFNIRSPTSHTPKELTKRNVLSRLMSIFDPLGLLSPLTIRGRILFQEVWRKNIDWDITLPPKEILRWKQWFSDISELIKLRIPRCYLKLIESNVVRRELHLFCDASKSAYAAVAYWRFVLADGSNQLSLISSKARVAPLKQISIPRLELQGALIAARLAATICNACSNKPTVRHFWCDSKNVLAWIRNKTHNLKTFVAHRIVEILEISSVSEWHWVPTAENVADDATRFRTGSICDRWFEGPKFLLLGSCDWPLESATDSISSEEISCKELTFLNVETECKNLLVANPERFSSWLKFQRATALAQNYLKLLKFRCLKNKLDVKKIVWLDGHITRFDLKDTDNRTNRTSYSVEPTAEDLIRVRHHTFLACQQASFSTEYRCLLSGTPLQAISKLRKIEIFLSQDGLIRLRGRAKLDDDNGNFMQHPILLDGNSRAVQLLIMFYHHKFAHANNETVLNEMRQQYHIFRLRSIIKKVAYGCQICRNRKATASIPPTGDLPPARLAHHKRPFSFLGLDYFGPVSVSIGRRIEKRWVAIFTCLTTRAIHIEIVYTLSADSAVMALRRFIARRGTPSEIWSDNGTSFVGATKELRKLYGAPVTTFAASNYIKWRFIPPAAPFMGGCWERLVRSVKTALKVTLRPAKSHQEELLLTVLAEAEALINSRPLTFVAVESDEEALTPNHFLLGSSSAAITPLQLDDRDLASRKNWKKAIRLSDIFWKRWLREYLPSLVPRQKTSSNHQNLAVGDVAVLVDENLPRGMWPKGKIVAVYPAKDGTVRVADLATAGGVLRRPARKLVRLPVLQNSS